jgi:Relaxase/Mobilisation nuclease domain
VVPRINAKGKSFQGLAAYLLHDPDRAATADRVAWTETVNIGSRNPETAWKVMAATAMSADYIKAKAGIKKTGRQSKDAVLHVSLSWDPEEKPTQAEMSAFAKRALAALKAQDRQAMIICHQDTGHAHVHIVINRVSPLDGRMLSSSNEKLALSRLALAYEKEQGKVVCPQRVRNTERRAKGEYVRAEEALPRPEYERMRAEQQKVEATIAPALLAHHHKTVRTLRAEFKARWRAKVTEAKQGRLLPWRALYEKQRAETREAGEAKALLVETLKSWLKQKPPPSPAPPFQYQNLKYLHQAEPSRCRQQRAERASLGQKLSREARGAIGEIKAIYEAGLKRLAFMIRQDLGKPPAPAPNRESYLKEVFARNRKLAQRDQARRDREKERDGPDFEM